MREKTVNSVSIVRLQSSTPTEHNTTVFLNHLNALQKPRNMRTRRLAQAEDDPELSKVAKLATVLRDLYNVVVTYKGICFYCKLTRFFHRSVIVDEKDELLSAPLMILPSKRKMPEYYQKITDPIDLTTIEQNIATGIYRGAETFDADINRVFTNCVRFNGRTSDLGITATRLKKIYQEAKITTVKKFEEIVGEKPPSCFTTNKNKSKCLYGW